MINGITKTDCAAVLDASPETMLSWSADTLPKTAKEAKKRSLDVFNAFKEQRQAGKNCNGVLLEEILAVAEANPGNPEIALAYSAGADKVMELLVQERDMKPLSGLCDQIDKIQKLYPENEGIAVWLVKARWQQMCCQSRIEALDVPRFYEGIEKLAVLHRKSVALVEWQGKALRLLISLYSQGMNDEATAASSSGNVRNLDKAEEEYNRLAALVKVFPRNRDLVRLRSEAAAQIGHAFSAHGQPNAAEHWLNETRLLHECFPDCEDMAFSHVCSLGMTIASMKSTDDTEKAEQFISEAEGIVSGSFQANVRLRKEYLAGLQDLMAFYTRTGMTEKVEECVPVVEKWSEDLEAEDRLLSRLRALRMRLLAHLDIHDMPAVEKDFNAMRAHGGTKFREIWEYFMDEAGQAILKEYCRAGQFDEAERMLHELTTISASLDRKTASIIRDELRTRRQTLQLIGLPELGESRFTEWFANYLSGGDPAAGQKVFGDRTQAGTLMTDIVRAVQLLLDIGADIKALEYYRIARAISDMLPYDDELAEQWMAAGILLLQSHVSEPHPRHAEALASELLDGSERFHKNKRLRSVRLVVRLYLCYVHLAAHENVLASRVYSEIMSEYREHVCWSGRHDAEIPALALRALSFQYLELGQVNIAIPHAADLKNMYDTHPGEDVGQSFVEVLLTLSGYLLSHRMENELAMMTAVVRRQYDNQSDDTRLRILWSALSDKLGMLRAANTGQTDGDDAQRSEQAAV